MTLERPRSFQRAGGSRRHARAAVLLAAAALAASCGIDSTVHVQVSDEAGRSVAGAHVMFASLDDGPRVRHEGRTDAAGGIDRELVPGRYRVDISARGFDSAAQELQVLPGIPVSMRFILPRLPVRRVIPP
jgi:hypothetical protein